MADELVSGLLKESDLRVVLVTAGDLSRRARELHRSSSASAALMAQALTEGAQLAARLAAEERLAHQPAAGV
jgi:molecular chaperone Hsp33